jgi:hypothetical protein
MTLPDKQAGKKYRCPLCLTYIDVPLASPGPPAAVHEAVGSPNGEPAGTNHVAGSLPPGLAELSKQADTEEEAQEIASVERWRRVDKGLGFHFVRLLVILACLLMALLHAIFAEFLAAEVHDMLENALVAGILLVAPAFGLLSAFWCFGIPTPTRARSLLIATYFFDLMSVPMAVLYFLSQVTPQAAFYTPLVGASLQMISWLLYVVLLRRLAVFFQDEIAADEGLQILIWGVPLSAAPWLVVWLLRQLNLAPFLGLLGWQGWQGLLGPVLGIIAYQGLMILAFVLIVLYIWFLFRQLRLIGRLREFIQGKVRLNQP